MLVTKNFSNIKNLSAINFVFKIRHQHRCYYPGLINAVISFVLISGFDNTESFVNQYKENWMSYAFQSHSEFLKNSTSARTDTNRTELPIRSVSSWLLLILTMASTMVTTWFIIVDHRVLHPRVLHSRITQ